MDSTYVITGLFIVLILMHFYTRWKDIQKKLHYLKKRRMECHELLTLSSESAPLDDIHTRLWVHEKFDREKGWYERQEVYSLKSGMFMLANYWLENKDEHTANRNVKFQKMTADEKNEYLQKHQSRGMKARILKK